MSGTRLDTQPSLGEQFLKIDYRTYPLMVQLAESPPEARPTLAIRLYLLCRKVATYVRHLCHFT